jgi:hypothetical protein
MPGRSVLVIASLAVLLALAAPTTATAATEVGDDCGATFDEGVTGTYTNVPEQKAANASPLPIAAPAAGIVTSWRLKSLSGQTTPVRMGVFRPVGPGSFLVAGASVQETAAFGVNSFPTRIPVQAGDRFGLIPVGASFFSCVTGNSDDITWSYKGNVEPGSTYQFAAGVQVRVPVVAVIEPDVDGDGFGDESQDGCPRSAAATAPCPPVKTTFKTKVGKKAILVTVSVSSAATVQVFGQVSWQVRGRPKGAAGRSKRPGDHGLIVGISAGGPRTVSAATPRKFRARLSKPILRRLGRITPRQALRALLTVRTTDIAGKVTEQRRRVKLKGREGA